MGIRIGVDVGGTFTKAIGYDLTDGVVARAVLPTTHDDPAGPAAGVVCVIADVAARVGNEHVELVTYSTTQAVNALLEGDVGTVGILGMGRRPDLRKSRKRTRLSDVELSPGRRMRTVHEFLDMTDGLDSASLAIALERLQSAGATAICVAEAFAPDAGEDERRAVTAALERGLPACSSSEMSGLYGLELRTVTAALNASILPIAVQTEQYVQRGVAEAGVRCPIMVMRGDGGAIDTEGFRRQPARTLYSGPAASVAGVLRFARLTDGVVLEVGGTSTNVAAVKAGKPALSYVQVASHATALRALDVRVVGVAGGSMLRARRGRLYGVGPRSAHIAGLEYVCYQQADAIEGASAELVAPRPGDPQEYVVLRLRDGRLCALTNTCAAVALGVVHDADYAAQGASRAAAWAGFVRAGGFLRLPAEEVARRMLVASVDAVADVVRAVVHDFELTDPELIAVGGGAGGLGRAVAAAMRLDCHVPDGAEVISSIGDALSHVRVEHERSIVAPTAADSAALANEAESACVAAGASADSVDVHVEYEASRSTLRAIATGTVGLAAGALPGRPPIGIDEAAAIFAARGLPVPNGIGAFWVAAGKASDVDPTAQVLVTDRYGDEVAAGRGGIVRLEAPGALDRAGELVTHATRWIGAAARPPTVRLVEGSRIVSIPPDASAMRESMTTSAGVLVVLAD